jgi:hypothetical protein
MRYITSRTKLQSGTDHHHGYGLIDIYKRALDNVIDDAMFIFLSLRAILRNPNDFMTSHSFLRHTYAI